MTVVACLCLLQDAVLRKQEGFHKKQESKFLDEKLQLLSENHELQEAVNGAGEARRMAAADVAQEARRMAAADVEDSNARVLREVQARNEVYILVAIDLTWESKLCQSVFRN